MLLIKAFKLPLSPPEIRLILIEIVGDCLSVAEGQCDLRRDRRCSIKPLLLTSGPIFVLKEAL